MGGGNPIEHVVVLMLENRSFDHMLGFLKQLNPEIDGLNGDETNPYDPSDPNSATVTVTPDAGYVTSVDPSHSVNGTTTQLWGGGEQVDPPPMDGFVYDYNEDGDTADQGAAIMECFNPQTVPAISTMAMSFGVFDQFHASIPGPTEPNRMYLYSATSHGAAGNDDAKLVIGYPQNTIYGNVYAAGKSFGIYYSDFPASLIMQQIRKPEYWPYIKQINKFYDDCAAGTLPNYSFLEPRWFDLPDLGASDEHPPHNVSLGEYLIADVYEAVRASPQWDKTLLIVMFDEHGGFYDHVPPPMDNIPNPDGLVGTDENPPFDFTRLGVRIPFVVASPWIKQGSVWHEPVEGEIPEGQSTSYWDHTSVCATVKNLFGLPEFLTNRDAWAASFHNSIVNLEAPRTDCPLNLPVPGGTEKRKRMRELQKVADTDEAIREGERRGLASQAPLTELQYEIMNIANGCAGGHHDVYSLTTEHEGALFVRKCLYEFWGRR